MTHLTRDVLVKAIVAEEMRSLTGNDYIQSLKDAYHKWGHQSSDDLCRKFNTLKKTNISVEQLEP
tara:strand:- start:187 stop:381 length:195 start_codon:yes stop_codon:yes gene_type:complete